MIQGDVFKFLLYKDKINAKWAVLSCYRQAIFYFKKIYRVLNFPLLREHISALQERKNQNNTDDPPEIQQIIDETLLDDIKLAISFENYLKGLLLDKGFLIHCIKTMKGIKNNNELRTLQKMQSKRPIKINEYLKYDKFTYVDIIQKNTLMNLSEQTLTYSSLLQEKYYQQLIQLDPIVLKILQARRDNRNILHFLYPGAWCIFGPDTSNEWISLINYVNNNIVESYSRVADFLKKNSNQNFPKIRPIPIY